MDEIDFQNMKKQCQESINKYTIMPIRRCNSIGECDDHQKKFVDEISDDYLNKISFNTVQKYKKMTEKIINQIQKRKRKGTVKFQTLGWKQAKEIKYWCNQNNIICNIVEDKNITQNKLQYMDSRYDFDFDDHGCNRSIVFVKDKQNVVYVQIETL